MNFNFDDLNESEEQEDAEESDLDVRETDEED